MFPASIAWGVGAGFAVFLAWALARELDPDHDVSAFVAAGLMLAGLLFFDLPTLLTLFWVLLLPRIVDRTVGLPARFLDSLAVLGLGSWLTWQGGWIYGLIMALAFLLDGLLPNPRRLHLPFAAGAVIVAGIGLVVRRGFSGEDALPLPAMLAILASSVLFLLVIVGSRRVESVGDATSETLQPRRVQAAQVLALPTAILAAWWDGGAGLTALLPVWEAMLGATLYRLVLLSHQFLTWTTVNAQR